MSDNLIREVLARYEEDFAANTWVVPGGKSRAIQHKCIERMVVRAGIWFDPPVMVRADPEMCVMIVTGHIGTKDGDRTEWSVGEAAPKNNKNAYPYSMAEKRGKDRVALKLIGLHGLLYSEEEADEFKQRGAAPRQSDRHINEDPADNDEPSWSQMAAQSMADALLKRAGPAAVEAFLAGARVKDALSRLEMDDHTWVMRIAAERRAVEPVASEVAA